MTNFFYVYKDGYIVNTSEMRIAFYVTHGYWPKDDEELDTWIKNLKNIVETVPEKSMTINRLAPIREVYAVKLYRDRTGCTLREAKDHVDELLGKKRGDTSG